MAVGSPARAATPEEGGCAPGEEPPLEQWRRPPCKRPSRSCGRSAASIAATIVYNNGQCTLDCVIRNISETGAKLSVPASVALQDRFDLTVPQRSATYRAHIAWQRRGEIGVLFDGVSRRAPDRSRHETAHSRA